MTCFFINSSSANFSLEDWYKQEAQDNMSKVILDTENELTGSISDYNDFTKDKLQEGSQVINQYSMNTLSTSSNNISYYSTFTIEEINSTVSELESNHYDQLVNAKIAENNQEIEAEFTQILEELLSE